MKTISCVKRNISSHFLRSFTLIEMLIFIALVVFIIVGAMCGQKYFSYGWLLGGVLGIIALLVCVFLLSAIIDCTSGGFTRIPKCHNGCCHGPSTFSGDEGDYEICQEGDSFYRKCKCNNKYQLRGRRFMIITENGTEKPYLIRRCFKGWCKDT